MREEVLVAVLLAAVGLAHWAPVRLRAVLGGNHLVLTGHAFLALGYALGLAVGDTPDVDRALDPFVGFVSGWLGFAAGSRFDARILRTLPARAYAVALAPAVAAAGLVGGASWAALWMGGVARTEALAASTVLAAAAASSGPTLAALARTRRAGRSTANRAALRLVEFSAGIGDVVVLLLAALAFGLLRPEGDGAIGLVLLTVAGGAVLGLTTWLLLGGRASRDERMLLGVGMLVLTAGIAAWLHVSTAAAAASAAVVVANLPGDRMVRLLRAVQRVERPAVVTVMTVSGWHVAGSLHPGFLPLLGAMTVVRLLAKVATGDRVRGLAPPGLAAPAGWGLGLTEQGVLGVVVALTFLHTWHDAIATTVLTVVAVGGLLNELVAPWALVRLVRSADPAREAA